MATDVQMEMRKYDSRFKQVGIGSTLRPMTSEPASQEEVGNTFPTKGATQGKKLETPTLISIYDDFILPLVVDFACQ